MKLVYTFLFVLIMSQTSAQWSNTDNQFYDSLQMPVCTQNGDQTNAVVIKSYPDSGYFVVWQDKRKGFYEPTQIFAQKYDKAGNQLWANNGVPVSAGTNSQHYTYSSNIDLRSYSVGATDSAGGLYLTYTDDSISTYAWYRIMVQHIKNTGSVAFPNAGYIVAQTPAGQGYNYTSPQLIADGKKGFFIAYMRIGQYLTNDLYVYCYRDQNGTMKYYGGGVMNEDAVEHKSASICGGDQTTLSYTNASVADYMLYPDLQNGCNVSMTLYSNTQVAFVGFNRLCRVKKDSRTRVIRRYNSFTDYHTVDKFYKKDSVIRLYSLTTFSNTQICTASGNVYTVRSDYVENFGRGFIEISNPNYETVSVKGTVIATSGNINVGIITANERNYINNSLTNYFTHAYYRPYEKYDSIPFELSTDASGFAYNIHQPPGMNKFNYGMDTLLYSGSAYNYNYSIASTGNKFFATTVSKTAGEKNVLLQQLKVSKITADSFAVQLATDNKMGVAIGREITTTGFTGTNISYYDPQIATDNHGNALFYIYEYNRFVRVSPIDDGAVLKWGPMGKSIGSVNAFDAVPFAAMDPINGTAVLAWHADSKNNIPANSGKNIYMRHIDNIFASNYQPPLNKIKLLSNQSNLINPAVLLGTTNKWYTFDDYYNAVPAVEMKDDYDLGNVNVSVYQNINTISTYNGTPYLDRNYTIKVQNDPAGTAISVRLFFTNTELEALKKEDPSVTDPGTLVVIKQPNTNVNQTAPAAYTPVAGEIEIKPSSWKVVEGGYYVEITVTGFSNFFIRSGSGALPLTWLNVAAQWKNANQANISWHVAEQQNIKEYTVQHSEDGRTFTDACTVSSSNLSSYNCTLAANDNTDNYYRILQKDTDGRSTFSKVVLLPSSTNLLLTVYPNPAHDRLYLKGISLYNRADIIDATGRTIQTHKISTDTQEINIRQIIPGSYMLILIGERNTQTIKFIKN